MVVFVILVVGVVLLGAFAVSVRRTERAEMRHVVDESASPLAVLSQPIARESSSGGTGQGALLGGGIALLLVGVVLLLSRPAPAAQPSRDEVIRLARDQYGLVVTEPGGKPAAPSGNGAPQPPRTGTTVPPAAAAPPAARVAVVVASGDSAPVVADKLVSAGVISDRAGFLSRLAGRGLDGAIKAGSFSLAPGTDLDTVINTLTA